MKVVLIEDEKPAARRLHRMLSKENLEVETMLHSVAEGITWFSENEHPDLIFLDIQLSDGLSFEIFEKVDVKSAVIFTTAYDEYALKAFKLNSVDYLLKPIDQNELHSAVAKFKSVNKSQSTQFDANYFKELLTGKSYKTRFTISVGQHLKIVETSEITCFYTENKATYLKNEHGRSYLLDTTLDMLEKELDPEKFFRINRQVIIQLKAIEDIVAYTNSRLKINLKKVDGSAFIVARERVKDFKNWLE
ncbi:LytR/AlgR family response regulator transcription factor [Flavimarina sp. Hel_I_48]|uniref:LytR/AlgR family response regulator transcription factor n=1 Tax=Flavimarina sp. Hel_I_48 TaxID=1392488 RepID=UPI0004DEE541|nr:LytTR family DNA-binding domain-containing protein [Flavimarina sp. Hel_I_48]